MGKEISRKKLIAALIGIAAIVVLILSGVFMWGKKAKSYRSIKIVEIEGTVTVSREGVSDLKPSVNMNLVSGDYMTTSKDAYVVLLLDTDKYVMLGESGAMKVTAQGNAANGKTSIQLDAGSVLSEIQNPLGADSTFDIVTPNATMSVRGTVFEVRKDKNNGEDTVSVLVYDGSVAVGVDGMEEKLYNAGEFTEFTAGASPKFLTEKENITEKQISSQILNRLKKIQESGRNLNTNGILPVSGTNAAQEETKPVPAKTEPTQQISTENNTVLAADSKDAAKPADREETRQAETNPVRTTAAETLPEETTQDIQTAAIPQETTYTQVPQGTAAPSYTQSVPEVTRPDDFDDSDDSDDYDEPESEAPTNPTTPSKPENPTMPSQPENPTTPTAPSQPEDPTNPTSPTKPTTPSQPENPTTPSQPEDPTNPVQKCKVICYRTYIALWGNEDGKLYSYVKNINPYTHTEIEVVKGDIIPQYNKPTDLTITMTPEGHVSEKADFVFVGWCTKDGAEWDFEKDTVESNMALYPIWQDAEGHKYYPVFYSDQTGDYPCNNIIENSEPKGEQ